jgi:hypothetical protein
MTRNVIDLGSIRRYLRRAPAPTNPIIYLTGVSGPRIAAAAARRADLGLLAQPGNSVHRSADRYPCWAADNGCYAQGDAFDLPAYLAWLARLPHPTSMQFATAPDVVADHAASWARSRDVLPRIRALGLPAAFVAQDGMEDDPSLDWSAFDALFIGGSDAWKLGPAARVLVAEARARGKWVHLGRVNSRIRLAYARAIGCHSADGTYLAFGPDTNLPKLLGWLDALNTVPAARTA